MYPAISNFFFVASQRARVRILFFFVLVFICLGRHYLKISFITFTLFFYVCVSCCIVRNLTIVSENKKNKA